MATVIGDLLLRAGLELGGLQRDLNNMQTMLQGVPQQMRAAMANAELMPQGAMQQQGQAMAQQLALGLEQDRQRVKDAITGSVTEAVQESARAAEATVAATAPAAAATDAVREANERAVQAIEERAAAEERASTVSRESAEAARRWGEMVNSSAHSLREIAADIAAVNAAFAAGEASFDDYAAAIQHARRQVDELGVAGGRGVAAEIARAEVALAKGREAAEAYARSLQPALNPQGGGGAAGVAAATTQAASAMGVLDTRMHGASHGAQRLNVTLASLLRQVTATHPAISQLANVLGTMAIGSVAMVGVMGALAALTIGWQRVTASTREARRETEEALDRLRELARQRSLPEGGQVEVDVGVARESIDSLRAQVQSLEAAREAALRATDAGVTSQVGPLTMQLNRARELLAQRLEEERAGTGALVEASQERARRLRAAEATNLSVIVSSGEATITEMRRINDRIREEQERIAALRATEAFTQQSFGYGMSPDQQAQLAESLSVIQALTAALNQLSQQREQAGAAAARALQQEVSLLSEARSLGALRGDDIRRALELEQRLSREIVSGTGSLEQRVRARRQLAELQEFMPAVQPQVTVPEAEVIIGGVRIENPDEMAEAYRRQVQERLDRERLDAQLNLTIQPTTRVTQNENERRRAAMQAAQEATAAFNESVRAGTELMSAFSDLATVTDSLGEGMAQALRSVQTVAEGMYRYQLGQNLSQGGQGMLGALSQVSGIVSIAAGAVGFVQGLFRQSEAQRQHADAVRQATEAVRRFRLEVSGFRPTTADSMGRVRGAIMGGRDQFEDIRRSQLVWDRGVGWQIAQIEGVLQGFGLSLQQVQAVAESLDIPIFDAAGRVVIENLYALASSINDAIGAIAGFRDTLDDRAQERDLRDRILGVDRTPQMQMEALFGDLGALAPRLFEQFLGGIDTSDTDALRRGLLQLLDAFAEGGQYIGAMMGGLQRDEFLQWLSRAADALSTMDEVTRNVTGALVNVPQGFRILNLELERFNAMQRSRAEDLARPPAPEPPPASTPARPERPEPRQPERPEGRGPIQPWEREPSVHYEDHRVFTFQVTQQPGEDGEAFARRVEAEVRRIDHEDDLIYGRKRR